VGECVARVKAAGMGGGRVRLAVVDGFLLFHDEEVLGRLDLGMFLRAPYDKVCVIMAGCTRICFACCGGY
jgi:uridine kinase